MYATIPRLPVCDVAEIDVRQSGYHFTDRDKLYDAPNQGFDRDIVLSKAIKKTGKVCKIFYFSILIAKFERLNTVRLACPKDPVTFVCCEVLRPSQHY